MGGKAIPWHNERKPTIPDGILIWLLVGSGARTEFQRNGFI